MVEHKDDCPWKNGFNKTLYARRSDGPDSILSVFDTGIEFDYNDWTVDADRDEFHQFKFCPMCSAPIPEEEHIF